MNRDKINGNKYEKKKFPQRRGEIRIDDEDRNSK